MVYASQARLYINSHDHSNPHYFTYAQHNRNCDAHTQFHPVALKNTFRAGNDYSPLDSDRRADKLNPAYRLTNSCSAYDRFHAFARDSTHANQRDPADIHAGTAYQSTSYRASYYGTSNCGTFSHGCTER